MLKGSQHDLFSGMHPSIRALAARKKAPLVEINFERKPGFKLAFADDLSPRAILFQLEVLVRTEIAGWSPGSVRYRWGP